MWGTVVKGKALGAWNTQICVYDGVHTPRIKFSFRIYNITLYSNNKEG